jgi:hypothetical protein
LQPLESEGPTKYGPHWDRTGSGDDVVEPVEQFVLLLLKTSDIGDDFIAMATHRVGMTSGDPVLALGEWRLRDQRSKPSVIGLIGEMSELFVDNGQFVAKVPKLRTDLNEPLLQHGPCHGGEV